MMAKTPKRSKVTIQLVAKEAGVDRSTVSRVFNRPEVLSRDTIERVKSVASRLGYSPNSAARALRTGRSQNIALIVPDLTNPFMPPIALAVQKEAAKRGYCVFIGNADEDPAHEEDLLKRFSDQVSGAVLASPRSDVPVIEALAKTVPLVLINRDVAGVPRVLIDAGQGMAQAVAHLARFGHERIVYVGGPSKSWANEQRRQAVIQAVAEYQIGLDEISAGVASFSSGVQIVDRLLAFKASACIAFDDVLAQGIYSGLNARQIEVPKDYSVVGCDDILHFPPLSTVSNPSPAAGRLAVDLLIASLSSNLDSDTRNVLNTDFVLRESVGPKPLL